MNKIRHSLAYELIIWYELHKWATAILKSISDGSRPKEIYYTALQLYGITQLMWLLCLTAGGNLCQYLKELLRPSDKLLSSTITFVLPRSTLFLGSAHFSKCKLPSPINVTNMLTNIWPVIVKNIIWFSGLVLSQRKKSRITGVSRGAHKSPVLRLWEQQAYPGATWISTEDDYIKTPCPCP